MAAPDADVFIDVRRADEVAAIGGLPAFLNIQASELDRFLSYIPRDRSVVEAARWLGLAIRCSHLTTSTEDAQISVVRGPAPASTSPAQSCAAAWPLSPASDATA